MKITFPKLSSVNRHQSGLTLIEIMVSSALLLVITLGLTAMFHQTQRAFKTSLQNVDVYEGARATLDLITRDLEQLAASPVFPSTNLHATNISVATAVPAVMPDGSTRLQEF